MSIPTFQKACSREIVKVFVVIARIETIIKTITNNGNSKSNSNVNNNNNNNDNSDNNNNNNIR